jgi:hypothetical protein
MIVTMQARYPGTDANGRKFRKGDRIAYCRTTRRVVESDPARIDAAASAQPANREPFIDLDTMWEDDCARRCGL